MRSRVHVASVAELITALCLILIRASIDVSIHTCEEGLLSEGGEGEASTSAPLIGQFRILTAGLDLA